MIMQLETTQDHRSFFLQLCTEGLQEANQTIDTYPINDPVSFATIILDCVARDVYERTIDYHEISLLQSMQIVALAQIGLVDLSSIQRMIKRSRNLRIKYEKRIKYSGWKQKPVLRILDGGLFDTNT